jgi:hypothetical protein
MSIMASLSRLGFLEGGPRAELVLWDAQLEQVTPETGCVFLGASPVDRLQVGSGVGLGSLCPCLVPLLFHAHVADAFPAGRAVQVLADARRDDRWEREEAC